MKLCAIGCGAHAESSHGPAQARYAARHAGVVLAGCSDLDAGRAERYRERFGFARSYADAWSMLAAERPDAVVLAVPEQATCAVACRVLELGYPLLLEKPPGRTLPELDRIAAAADGAGRPVPHQVAFNRRYAPLVRAARGRIDAAGTPVTHLHYEMTRVDRRDPDFSTTAIHGIDAVRFLAGADYASVRFSYREHAALGPGVADVFMDAVMTSGATAHLAFCPVAGVVVERATVHAHGHSLFLQVPMWSGVDSPGHLRHFQDGRLREQVSGAEGDEPFVLGGFYGELEAFLDDLAAGRVPSPGLREARQSVAVAERIRHRESEYHA
jgi:myo-inositol 2-dehydrogenase / D-chiro-inositol 1-dehydrogenase